MPETFQYNEGLFWNTNFGHLEYLKWMSFWVSFVTKLFCNIFQELFLSADSLLYYYRDATLC